MVDSESHRNVSASPIGTPTKRYDLQFHGSGTSFFLIFLKNILLSLLTLGIYFAWAKTERRKYVWQNFEFNGQHFRYTGTGVELFKGYLVVVFAYGAFFWLSYFAGLVSAHLKTAFEIAFVLGVFLIIPSIIYRSRHYLYSRTNWRGIRFGLEPQNGEYTKSFFLGYLYTILSFGIYLPIMTNRLYRVMMNNTRFGTLEFSYTGKDREAWRMGIAAFFLSIVTLGFYYPCYLAKIAKYRGRHTRVGPDACLDYQMTGGDFLWIFLLNIWGTTLTLGLAFPWITMYSLRYMTKRIYVEGEIDFDSIEQREGGAGAVADGFADAFDIGLGV
jgi:uncharacterized membrane protein YjgN (DUF898 family)